MPQPISSTLDRIHAAARDEFLAKGYQAASLRNIVKTAGVTTGAFYGYYDSKEALFAALVDEPYRHVLETYRTAVFGFEALRPEEQVTQMGQVGKTCMQELLVYMDARRPVFRLILQGAEGTPYAGLIDELVAMEVDQALLRGPALARQRRAADRPAAGAYARHRDDERLLRGHPARHAAGRRAAVRGGAGRFLHGRMAENYGAVMLCNFLPGS